MATSPSKDKAVVLPSLGGTLGFGEVTTCDGFQVRRLEEPFCVLCNRHYVSQHLFDSHLDGFTHKEALKRRVKPGLFGCGELYEHISKTLEPIQKRSTGD